MFCLKCGKEIDDTAMACPFCGCATENAGIPIDSHVVDDSLKSADGLGTAAIAVGAIGIVLALLLAILGYFFGGGGIAMALIAKSKNKDSKKAKTGLIVSVIALVCAVVNSIIGAAMMM